MSVYRFRAVTTLDLPTVNAWLKEPAVSEWWIDADGEPSAPISGDDLNNPAVSMQIVSYCARPFAFIQDYDPHAWPNHHFGHLPPRSRGIDQFIGEPSMLGCGHGSAFIRAYADRLIALGAPAIGTDPHPANARAIRAYGKAGFQRKEERVTEWGRCLLMERYAGNTGYQQPRGD